MATSLRLALVGFGAIGQAVAAGLTEPGIEIVAVAVRDAATDRPSLPESATLISDPEELEEFEPDVVAEAAGRDSVAIWGAAALDAGADFIVSSVSAFADQALLESLRTKAVVRGTQLHIQPGALAGIDALGGARRMGIDQVEHRMVKPCLLYTSPSPRDATLSRMPSSA